MFCRKCGKEIPDDSNVCQYCGVAVVRNQNENVSKEVVASQVAVAEKPKKTVWKIIVPIVTVILVIAIVCGIFIIRNISVQNKLRKLIKEATDEPIVEFLYDDFDKDGAKEAFVVAGEGNNAGDFSDSEIYFVNDSGAQIIKESAEGYLCGVIESHDRIYVSVEIFKDEENHRSDIYTVIDSTPAKSDLSGKYENVMEVDGEITGVDPDTREVVEIDIDVIATVKPITPVNKNYLEATDEDWKKFDEFINIPNINKINFAVNSPRALAQVYDCLTDSYGRGVYGLFFADEDAEIFSSSGEFEMSTGNYEYATPDPLGRFGGYLSYGKYPADNIGWIIENVFGLTPDREISTSAYYYQDEYFYCGIPEGGIDFPEFTTEYEKLSDGRYKFVSNGKYAYGDKAKYLVEGVIGLVEVDGKRIWKVSEMRTFSTETGEPLAPNTAVNYLGKPLADVINQYGENFYTYYFEGGDFAYHPDAYPLMGFCPEGLIDKSNGDTKNKTVKYIFAWETSHLYKDFYADMSYNELKELVSDIERPQFSEFDDTYYISFVLDGYNFTYRWFDKPDDNTKSSEAMLSVATE